MRYTDKPQTSPDVWGLSVFRALGLSVYLLDYLLDVVLTATADCASFSSVHYFFEGLEALFADSLLNLPTGNTLAVTDNFICLSHIVV